MWGNGDIGVIGKDRRQFVQCYIGSLVVPVEAMQQIQSKNMWNKIAFFMVVSFFEHIIIPVCITETGM